MLPATEDRLVRLDPTQIGENLDSAPSARDRLTCSLARGVARDRADLGAAGLRRMPELAADRARDFWPALSLGPASRATKASTSRRRERTIAVERLSADLAFSMVPAWRGAIAGRAAELGRRGFLAVAGECRTTLNACFLHGGFIGFAKPESELVG